MDLLYSPDLNILLVLLLSRTHLKYLCCAWDKAFVNITGLPLAGRTERRGMQRWQLFAESAAVYHTPVSLQHIWDATETPQPRSTVHAYRGNEISVERFLSLPHGAVTGYTVTILIRICATQQRRGRPSQSGPWSVSADVTGRNIKHSDSTKLS